MVLFFLFGYNSLPFLGISNDDLGLLLDSGYGLNQTSGISEAQRDEILAKVYELKKEKASKQEDAKLKEAVDELKKGLENASTEDEKKQVLEKFNDTIGTTVYSDYTMAENSSREEIADTLRLRCNELGKMTFDEEEMEKLKKEQELKFKEGKKQQKSKK